MKDRLRDAADATSPAQTIEITLADPNDPAKSERFRIGIPSMKTCGRLQGWLNRQRPPGGSLREAREICEGLESETVKGILEDAYARERQWPPSVVFNPLVAFMAMCEMKGGGR